MSNQSTGAPGKPSRMVIGAIVIKHVKSLTDEKTIAEIQENPGPPHASSPRTWSHS